MCLSFFFPNQSFTANHIYSVIFNLAISLKFFTFQTTDETSFHFFAFNFVLKSRDHKNFSKELNSTNPFFSEMRKPVNQDSSDNIQANGCDNNEEGNVIE